VKSLIIGDSHVIRIRRCLPYDIRVNECNWGDDRPAEYDKPTCEYEHLLKGAELPEDVYFSAHKGRNAWTSHTVLNELNPCIKKVVTDDMLIFPFFGYIDAKIQLVKYKDPEEAVIKYINTFLKEFPNNKIRFIEPIPQFINNLGTGPDIYDFKDRYPMHKEFVYHLRKQCLERGLEAPISPENIFGVDKFDESYECHECDYCLSKESQGIKWDHLKNKFNKKLLDEILSEVLQ
jgi:hypothetical protein